MSKCQVCAESAFVYHTEQAAILCEACVPTPRKEGSKSFEHQRYGDALQRPTPQSCPSMPVSAAVVPGLSSSSARQQSSLVGQDGAEGGTTVGSAAETSVNSTSDMLASTRQATMSAAAQVEKYVTDPTMRQFLLGLLEMSEKAVKTSAEALEAVTRVEQRVIAAFQMLAPDPPTGPHPQCMVLGTAKYRYEIGNLVKEDEIDLVEGTTTGGYVCSMATWNQMCCHLVGGNADNPRYGVVWLLSFEKAYTSGGLVLGLNGAGEYVIVVLDKDWAAATLWDTLEDYIKDKLAGTVAQRQLQALKFEEFQGKPLDFGDSQLRPMKQACLAYAQQVYRTVVAHNSLAASAFRFLDCLSLQCISEYGSDKRQLVLDWLAQSHPLLQPSHATSEPAAPSIPSLQEPLPPSIASSESSEQWLVAHTVGSGGGGGGGGGGGIAGQSTALHKTTGGGGQSNAPQTTTGGKDQRPISPDNGKQEPSKPSSASAEPSVQPTQPAGKAVVKATSTQETTAATQPPVQKPQQSQPAQLAAQSPPSDNGQPAAEQQPAAPARRIRAGFQAYKPPTRKE